MVSQTGQRVPQNLEGDDVVAMQDAVVPAFSSNPLPPIRVQNFGETVHYTLEEGDFGPAAAVDLLIAEVNRSEMRRTIGIDEQRKAFMFAEISVPVKVLQFDCLVHGDVYPQSDPSLRIYDTAFEGVADVNNPACDINRLDMLETIESLGLDVRRIGSSIVPRYGEMVQFVCDQLGWDARALRAYRCQIDYPVYGSQIAMCFDPPRAP